MNKKDILDTLYSAERALDTLAPGMTSLYAVDWKQLNEDMMKVRAARKELERELESEGS